MVTKGDLYWLDFDPAVSSAPLKRRPAVVVQSDHFNRSRLSTVVVAAISSNTALADHPGNVFLPAATTGSPRDSVVNGACDRRHGSPLRADRRAAELPDIGA